MPNRLHAPSDLRFKVFDRADVLRGAARIDNAIPNNSNLDVVVASFVGNYRRTSLCHAHQQFPCLTVGR